MQQNVRACLDLMTREIRSIDEIINIDDTPDNSSLEFSFIEETGSATGGTSDSLIDTSQSWGKDAWNGNTLVILDGTGKGQTSTIVPKDDDDPDGCLRVSPDWETIPPDNTSLYYIQGKRGFKRDAAKNEIDYEKDQGTQVFADNITGLTFKGYDASGTPTDTPAAIRRLVITLTGRTAFVDPSTNQYHSYTARTSFSKNIK